MVSDQEIASCVESLLRKVDPSFAGGGGANLTSVVRQVEAKFGLDLSHKSAFIRDQIELLVGPRRPPAPTKGQHGQITSPISHFQRHHLPPLQATPQLLLQPLRQIPASTPFSHLASPHHELTFGYAPPAGQAVLVPAAAVVAAQHLQQQQQELATTGDVRPVSASPNESASTGVKRKGGPGGLSKVCGVSPELQVIVGEPAMPRTQIVKQLWTYIRKNNLQDPNNKRRIICNDELRQVFETDCTDMFKMNKLLAKHIIPLDPTKNVDPDTKRVKTNTAYSESSSSHVIISDALAKFFDTQEKEMLQSDITKRIWDYINDNQLKDATNPRAIVCDSKLHQLFGCDNIPVSGVFELLEGHLKKSRDVLL